MITVPPGIVGSGKASSRLAGSRKPRLPLRAVAQTVAFWPVLPSLTRWSTQATIARWSAPSATLRCMAALTLPSSETAVQRLEPAKYSRDSIFPLRSQAASTSPESLTATETERMCPRPEIFSVGPGELTPFCRTT